MEEQVKSLLVNRLLTLSRAVEQVRDSDQDSQDLILIRLESLYVDLIEIDLCNNCIHPSVLSKVFECLHLLEESFQHSDIGCPGRPSFDVSSACIESLMELKFTTSEIGAILGVSRSTICRRMRQNGLSYSRNYCCISDSNLDDIVRTISHEYPGCGSKMMEGHLRERGITVQQVRVRESLRRTDPEGTAIRYRINIRRRVYDVSYPQELWHIDGNHKLIRLGL